MKAGGVSDSSHVNTEFRSSDKLPVSDHPCSLLFTVITSEQPCHTSRAPQKKEHFNIWRDENILKTFLRPNPNRMQMRFSLTSQDA